MTEVNLFGLPIPLPDLTRDALSEVVVAVAAALLVLLWQKGTQRIRHGRFTRIFGRNATSAKKLAVCVPMWTLMAGDRSIPRFEKTSTNDRRRLLYGPSETFSEGDVRAAFEFGSLFNTIFKEPVKIVPDCRLLDSDVTTVLIGAPVANFHVEALLNVAHEEGLPIRFAEVRESGVTEAAGKIEDVGQGDSFAFDPAKRLDYAVLIRLKRKPAGAYAIICAGIDASGTWAAAKYFRNRWYEFDDGSEILRDRTQPHSRRNRGDASGAQICAPQGRGMGGEAPSEAKASESEAERGGSDRRDDFADGQRSEPAVANRGLIDGQMRRVVPSDPFRPRAL